MIRIFTALAIAFCLWACQDAPEKKTDTALKCVVDTARFDIYAPVRLTTNIAALTDEQRQVLPLLIEAAQIMDEIFWKEAWGDKASLLSRIDNERARQFAMVNYGPWDRLNGNAPIFDGIGPKPAGAGFYPADMTKEEFEAWNDPLGKNEYSVVTREADGKLKAHWYHDYFADEVKRAAALLRQAAGITTDKAFATYLQLRAEALETDRYKASDIAWLGMKDNVLDIIIGPIENYEDQLYGRKCAHEAYVLVRDAEWSRKLNRFASMLPDLQKQLPVEDTYKRDAVGTDSQLAAFDVVFYAGDCNSGSKTIAVNLPNDEEIQQQHGTRKSQLQNAMRAKYEQILTPINYMLIDVTQRGYVNFDSFFSNVMFHEVAHGLGVKNLVNRPGLVKEALQEEAAALEEAKADVLGLWLVGRLREMGEITSGQMMNNYVTFVAGIFRSCRFGASSAHGKANMLTFNYLQSKGAFSRNDAQGTYIVDGDKMKAAIDELAGMILRLQGDGDYEAVKKLMQTEGVIKPSLQRDLERINSHRIPVDVVFEQGRSVLGL